VAKPSSSVICKITISAEILIAKVQPYIKPSYEIRQEMARDTFPLASTTEILATNNKNIANLMKLRRL